MSAIQIVYWQEGEKWLGHLRDYPAFLTQGESPEELKENLKDIHRDILSGNIPGVEHSKGTSQKPSSDVSAPPAG
jgi:hypothetical protein